MELKELGESGHSVFPWNRNTGFQEAAAWVKGGPVLDCLFFEAFVGLVFFLYLGVSVGMYLSLGI